MKLQVYLDLSNVSGYLALPGIHALIAENGVDAQWLPIEGIVPRPFSPERSFDQDDPLAEFKRLRWAAKHDFEQAELRRDCARLGLDSELASRNFPSALLHQVWLFVSDTQPTSVPALVDAAYRRRFNEGIALQEETEIADLLTGLNLDAQSFLQAPEQWQARWEAHKEAYLAVGIHDSPAFVLGEETFQGRQHLPLIRWQIQASQGLENLGTPPV